MRPWWVDTEEFDPELHLTCPRCGENGHREHQCPYSAAQVEQMWRDCASTPLPVAEAER